MRVTTLVALFLAPCTALAANPLHARQYPDPYDARGPFLLQTRNQDVSNGHAEYNLLSLAQATDSAGAPTMRGRLTWTGDAPTRFRLRRGAMSAHIDYTDSEGAEQRGKWRDAARHSGRAFEFKLQGKSKNGTMNVELGTHAFLSPGGEFSESDWTYCRAVKTGVADYGLAIGNVPGLAGIRCQPVYVFLVPTDYYG